jgi:uncharacterized SAM-binding protein YcdF (DUF218 family)
MQMLVNPLSVTLVAVLVLMLLWFMTRRRGFLNAVMLLCMLLWLAATPWLSHNVESLLERRAGESTAESLPRADAIVILGGTLAPPGASGGNANLSSAADRLVYGAQLYELGKAPRILIAGGSGAGESTEAESIHASALLSAWGIPATALLTETESVNTYENAVYSKLILKQHGLKKVLLVTSAMHMPRALATFRSAGIEATPAATDFEAAGPGPSGLSAWIASPGALEVTTRVIKEYVGWLVYRNRGWIAGDAGS